ncbi:unnamed protein product [Prorocentrum cordatum]|uniref:Sulfotransferase domain-containing protein n=1 Tax=Prorocentrum cordatum TaxID=2364126 RepID=A0ABN9T5G8_9DINO|nr:unnamed protein product [Polarella glacialis]
MAPPAQQVQLPERGLCEDVSFLRIQKTGSTSFGDAIINKMCKDSGMFHRAFWHMDYNIATQSSAGCVVTFLRDPVDRFISEFAMMRGPEQNYTYGQDQWDYHVLDQPRMRELMTKQPVEDALREFVDWPGNAGRNRQALYLLGFKRVACNRGCCGLCTLEYRRPGSDPGWFPIQVPERAVSNTPKQGAGGYPARQYSWEADHDSLLATTQANLLSLRAFGMTHCYEESLEVIAREVGWDPEKALRLAKGSRAFRASTSREAKAIKAKGKELAGDIRRLNRLDDELVSWALEQFRQRYGRSDGPYPGGAENSTCAPRGGLQQQLAMQSEVVKAELDLLVKDHKALVKMGETYGSFDPAGKAIFLDQVEAVESRWEVFISRFQLMGELNPDYVQQANSFLESSGLSVAGFRQLLREAHTAMRQDAEREALGG